MTISYDLGTEGWIPVRMADGSRTTVGLLDAILRAHDIASLDLAIPLEEIGMFRVLMAIAYRSVDGPRKQEERKALYEGGRFSEDKVRSYFREYSDRFDLFDETHPFLQTPGLSVLDKDGNESPLPVELLCFECVNNKTLFEHHGVQNPRVLGPDEAARKLIAFQYYALPGLAKKNINIASIGYQQSFLNAPLVSGIATILTGPTLFDTLCLNMITVNSNTPIAEIDHDRNEPPWEREPRLEAGRSVPYGYFDYLVPISRHSRLIPEKLDGRTIVRTMHLTQGLAYTSDLEPMFFFKRDRKDPTQKYPAGLRADKALWRDSAALFSFAEETQGGDLRSFAFREFGPLRTVYEKSKRPERLCVAPRTAS